MSTVETYSEDIEIRIRRENHGYTVSGVYLDVASQFAIADLSELESAISKVKQTGLEYWK